MNFSKEQEEKYIDIIDKKRPVSQNHISMSSYDRSAQFSPFAALTGYDAAVKNAEKSENQRALLFEDSENEIDKKLKIISKYIQNKPFIKVIFFEFDEDGRGNYTSAEGIVEKIDEYENQIILKGGLSVSIDDIYFIEGEIFNNIF